MAEYDYNAISAALGELWLIREGRCPACQSHPTIWGGSDAVVALPAMDKATANGNPLNPAKQRLEVVVVACDHCGWTQFFQPSILVK